MKIYGIQNNQKVFGTKVKMNKKLKQAFASKDGGAALNEYIRVLENNGINDNFFIASGINKQNHPFLHADVMKLKGIQLYVGKSIEQILPEEGCPNLTKMYSEASQNLHPIL